MLRQERWSPFRVRSCIQDKGTVSARGYNRPLWNFSCRCHANFTYFCRAVSNQNSSIVCQARRLRCRHGGRAAFRLQVPDLSANVPARAEMTAHALGRVTRSNAKTA